MVLRSEGSAGGGAGGSIEPFEESARWRAAKSAEERDVAAAEWVRAGQESSGAEHAVIFTRDGRFLWAGSSGRREEVRPPWEALDLPDDGVFIHHSHPEPRSLSLGDFFVMWARNRARMIWAHGPFGASFGGYPVADPVEWAGLAEALSERAAFRFSALQKRYKRSFVHLVLHARNLELQRRGLIVYEHSLPKGAAEDIRFLDAEFFDLLVNLAGVN